MNKKVEPMVTNRDLEERSWEFDDRGGDDQQDQAAVEKIAFYLLA